MKTDAETGELSDDECKATKQKSWKQKKINKRKEYQEAKRI